MCRRERQNLNAKTRRRKEAKRQRNITDTVWGCFAKRPAKRDNETLMSEIDKRGRLDETPFDYDVTKDGRAFLYWQRRQVMTLKGDKARKFLAQVEGLDERDAQLVMAKITGNFKRGNER